MSAPDRDVYVARVTDFLLPKDPDERDAVLESRFLAGLYTGKSRRIRRLLSIAYGRGVRRGASAAWSAQRPITLRSQ